MAQFINRKEDTVLEALDGVIAASGGKLSRLDGYPFIRVVIRSDWDKSKVALISGGGSGHEPAHAGFVGEGMLTAAVCGDVFASPSVDAVLAGILAVTGPQGCLLIVKNYTGDRLNFGLAAERAKALGLRVEMVIVGDDISLPEAPQPRGVAGTLFVHKIAGAMAESGASLDDITAAADRVIARTRSISMSLDTCTVPGSPKEDRIAEGQAELGLGIHGEAGVQKIIFHSARRAMDAVVEKLKAEMEDTPNVALLNNLGGLSSLEMSVLANDLIQSSIGKNVDMLVGPAPLMTSIDMRGFSVSVYPFSAADRDLLSARCDTLAWPGCAEVLPVRVVDMPVALQPIKFKASAQMATKALLAKSCGVLICAEAELNALDAKSGDGDTGSTLAAASRALLAKLDQLPLADHTQLLRAIGQELAQTMGGSSGVLLAIFFTAAGDAAAAGLSLVKALQQGLVRMQDVGGARPGDRTMVDALKPALEALDAAGLQEAAIAARNGATRTAAITTAKAGRAAYVNAEHLSGNIDPGAEAVARLFEGVAT